MGLRNKDFISGIIQIRFLKNITAGFAYDYSINRIRSIATNSVEFMIGFTPLMKAADIGSMDHAVSKCPVFDY
jgi:hypothetical protein